MRTAFAVNAVVAWAGVALNLVSALLPPAAGAATERIDGALYGSVPTDAWGRVVDMLSYFTIWSVVVVAVWTTLLAVDPGKDTGRRRALRHSGLLMITITAAVYALILAPVMVLRGLSVVANPWVHVLVPALTVIVWVVWGPRGWIGARTVAASLVVPLVWVVYALTRGAVDGLYPYGFLDVTHRGLGPVLVTVLQILAVGLALAVVFRLLDAVLPRGGTRPGSRTPIAPTRGA